MRPHHPHPQGNDSDDELEYTAPAAAGGKTTSGGGAGGARGGRRPSGSSDDDDSDDSDESEDDDDDDGAFSDDPLGQSLEKPTDMALAVGGALGGFRWHLWPVLSGLRNQSCGVLSLCLGADCFMYSVGEDYQRVHFVSLLAA